MKNYTKHTAEFKQQAVKLIVEGGKSVTEVAFELGISRPSLYKWHDQYQKKSKLMNNVSATEPQAGQSDNEEIIKELRSDIKALQRAFVCFAKHSIILD